MKKRTKKYTEAISPTPKLCFQVKALIFVLVTYCGLALFYPASIRKMVNKPLYIPTGRSSK